MIDRLGEACVCDKRLLGASADVSDGDENRIWILKSAVEKNNSPELNSRYYREF